MSNCVGVFSSDFFVWFNFFFLSLTHSGSSVFSSNERKKLYIFETHSQFYYILLLSILIHFLGVFNVIERRKNFFLKKYFSTFLDFFSRFILLIPCLNVIIFCYLLFLICKCFSVLVIYTQIFILNVLKFETAIFGGTHFEIRCSGPTAWNWLNLWLIETMVKLAQSPRWNCFGVNIGIGFLPYQALSFLTERGLWKFTHMNKFECKCLIYCHEISDLTKPR